MQDNPKATQTGDKDDKFSDILNCVSDAWFNSEYQREKSGEAIRFVDVAGGQWEDWYAQQFANRPRLELDITSQAVHSFNGEWRKGRFNVKYRPDDTKASEQDAELANKLYRTDFRKSNGTQAVDNAVSEMSKGGCAAIKLCAKYLVEDDPEDLRQRIDFREIINAFNTVIWDPNAKR